MTPRLDVALANLIADLEGAYSCLCGADAEPRPQGMTAKSDWIKSNDLEAKAQGGQRIKAAGI
jgi:hypothetical protein